MVRMSNFQTYSYTYIHTYTHKYSINNLLLLLIKLFLIKTVSLFAGVKLATACFIHIMSVNGRYNLYYMNEIYLIYTSILHLIM